MIKLRIGRLGGLDIAKPTLLELAGLALVLLFAAAVLAFCR